MWDMLYILSLHLHLLYANPCNRRPYNQLLIIQLTSNLSILYCPIRITPFAYWWFLTCFRDRKTLRHYDLWCWDSKQPNAVEDESRCGIFLFLSVYFHFYRFLVRDTQTNKINSFHTTDQHISFSPLLKTDIFSQK